MRKTTHLSDEPFLLLLLSFSYGFVMSEKNDDLMNFACNKLLYRTVTLHHFLIRLLAKKEMMISLFISIIFR